MRGRPSPEAAEVRDMRGSQGDLHMQENFGLILCSLSFGHTAALPYFAAVPLFKSFVLVESKEATCLAMALVAGLSKGHNISVVGAACCSKATYAASVQQPKCVCPTEVRSSNIQGQILGKLQCGKILPRSFQIPI